MKLSKFDTLFLILFIVGIMLMGYGISAGAYTSFNFSKQGFQFISDNLPNIYF